MVPRHAYDAHEQEGHQRSANLPRYGLRLLQHGAPYVQQDSRGTRQRRVQATHRLRRTKPTPAGRPRTSTKAKAVAETSAEPAARARRLWSAQSSVRATLLRGLSKTSM